MNAGSYGMNHWQYLRLGNEYADVYEAPEGGYYIVSCEPYQWAYLLQVERVRLDGEHVEVLERFGADEQHIMQWQQVDEETAAAIWTAYVDQLTDEYLETDL